MGKANTGGRPDDPDMAPEAALATDLGDEGERRKTQLSYFGGEDDDDIDNFDPSGLDDGSDPDRAPTVADDDKPDDSGEEGEEGESNDDAAEEQDEVEETDEKVDDSDDESGDNDGKTDDSDESEEDSDKKPSKGIPKHRFDEVNERRKKAEDELAALKAEREAEAKGKTEEYDFDAKEEEYMELLLDGKTKEALALRKEIRTAEKATWQTETTVKTKSELSQEEAQAEVASITRQAEKLFPVFDDKHEDFDPAITKKVLTFYRGYLNDGETMADAMVSAIADAAQIFNLEDRYPPEGKKPAKGKVDPKPTGKKRDDDKTRKKDETRKQAHQPVGGAGAGSTDAGTGSIDLDNMTDEEIDALPAKTLARLRGDFI